MWSVILDEIVLYWVETLLLYVRQMPVSFNINYD